MTGRTFYTSDLHFGHRLVAGKRGFGEVIEFTDVLAGEPVQVRETRVTPEDVERHDEHLIETWNVIVQPDDTVWVLGDITLRAFTDEAWKVWRLNGVKHLVLGNHDEAHPMHRGAHKKLWLYHGGFETVQTMATVRLEGQQVMLSHFPYTGDRGEDRCNAFRLRDEGHPVIHGHTHLPGQITCTDKGTLQIHVGMDAHGMRPVPEAWVMRMLREHGKAAA